jgi:hypothetical protein
MAAFSATAPVNPSERQSERLSPGQMRICGPPSIRHWIRQRKADRTGVVAVPPKGDNYALRHEQSERPFVVHHHGLTGLPRGGPAEAEPRP